MMRFYVEPRTTEGTIGVGLTKYGVEYRAEVQLSGTMQLSKIEGEEKTELKSASISPTHTGKATLLKFAVVDHRLLFAFGDTELEVDLGRSADALERRPEFSPRAAILGAGDLTLSHVALFRDIYYTDGSESPPSSAQRAVEGKPFTLNEDEFFALGDNSPNSSDGRYWSEPTDATKGTDPPRAGVVPRYYLVGKALFVYWPSGFEFPWPAAIKTALLNGGERYRPLRVLYTLVSLRWIPNFGEMRFIHGGQNERESSNQTTTGSNEG
jgi:hypothetical protein